MVLFNKNKKSLFEQIVRFVLFLRIFRWIKHKLFFRNFLTYESKQQSIPSTILDKPSGPGRKTGYEPQSLKYVKLRNHVLMIGNPGSGLSSSGFDQKIIDLGQKGEINFAKALQKEFILDRLLSFWSVHNLNLNDEKVEADVDCIIVSAKTIWLIDLKFYASGDVTYRTDDWYFYTIDNKTGFQVREPKKMTRNMYFADKAFKKKFQNLSRYFDIQSRVVLMPTYNGAGSLDNVYWPGGIRAVSLEEMLAILKAEPSFQDTIGGQKIKQTFNVLVKRDRHP